MIFYCPNFPTSMVFNDGHELWIEMPSTFRYKFGYLDALAENILTTGYCDPIRTYQNIDGVIIGCSGVNRYQAILVLGWTEFPAFFIAEDINIPLRYTDRAFEISDQDAIGMIKNRPCESIDEHGVGYKYPKSFQPIDFLTNFIASEDTRQRMFTCFLLENLQGQQWGLTRQDLTEQFNQAKILGLTDKYQQICQQGFKTFN